MAEIRKTEQMEEVLRFVSPGTAMRQGLDNVLRANTGGLIVVGYSNEVMALVDGGFSINCEYTPATIYELAKMDGAIILSADGKRILLANTQLVPDYSIPSRETGIRHRTAERVAKQVGHLVISISQRRNVITLYQGNFRYSLRDMGVILTKANQAIQTLEKYKSVLDQAMTNLGALEFEELVTLQEVSVVIHRIEMVLRIKEEITRYIYELGTEGRLVSLQMEELVANIEQDTQRLIRDYCHHSTENTQDILTDLKRMSADELLDKQTIVRLLGYEGQVNIREEAVSPRGYRILHKIPRIPSSIVHNIVEEFGDLPSVMMATIEELDDVEGVGEVRARAIKDGLMRIQEQLFIDRHI